MIACVDTVEIDGGSNGGTSNAIDTTGANLLVICTSRFGTKQTPTDSKNNVWLEGIAEDSVLESTFGLSIYYCLNPTVGAGHTFSISSQYSSGSAMAFSGVKQLGAPQAIGVVDGQQTENDHATSAFVQPGSLTPPENGALFIAAAAFATYPDSGDDDVSIDSDFILVDQQPYDGAKACFGSMSAYLIQDGGSTAAPTITYSLGTPGPAFLAQAALLQFDPVPVVGSSGLYLGRVRVVSSAPAGVANPFVGKVNIITDAPAGVADPYLGQIIEVSSVPSGHANPTLGDVTVVSSAPDGAPDPFLGSVKH